MIVQKGNKQIRVADDRLADMQARGFVQVDEKTGKLMKKEPADEIKSLKKENAALKKENKELADKLAAALSKDGQ